MAAIEPFLQGVNDPQIMNINSAFHPIGVTCPKCNADIMTECKYKFGIWNLCNCICCHNWTFCCLPVWFKWFRDVTHVCPKCQAEICHVNKCPFCIKQGNAIANEANQEAKQAAA